MKRNREEEFRFAEDDELENQNDSPEDTSSEERDEKLKSKEDENSKGKTSKRKPSLTTRLKKRIEELEDEIIEKEKEIEELKDRNIRLHAEFDNFKKRLEKELHRVRKYAGEEILLDILSIVDDMERTLKAIDDGDDEESVNINHKSIIEGVELIYNKFLKFLEKWDVYPIETIGKPFDPDFHEAMMMRHDEESESNIVLEEFEKGYTFRDKVLRHAKVVVSE